jgi:DNA repair protein RadC
MNNYKISDMSVTERPYEKCINYGPKVLTDTELLAVFLRSGSKKRNVLDVAGMVLNAHPVHKGIVGLNFLSLKELSAIEGVGKVKAVQLQCLAEFSRRMSMASYKPFIELHNPSSIADYFMESSRYLTRERIYALLFDSNNKLIKDIILTEGTVNKALISPRELFIEALKVEAVSVILVHNHPSGNPSPSEEDYKITERIKAAGDVIGISLLDHIVLGNNCYVSMAEQGVL